jgi:amino acid transporter
MSNLPSTAAEQPNRLAKGSISIRHLVFFVVAAAAPLTAVTANGPISIAFGGPAASIAFIVAGVVLGLFAAGFTAMSLFVRNAGAFYTYITRGLGKPLGLGSALLAVFSYNSIQISQYALFAVFATEGIQTLTGVAVPWPILVFVAILIVTFLGYRNIVLSANVLGFFLVAEVLILLMLALGVIIGGGAEGLTLQPLNPAGLFDFPGWGVMLAFTFLSFIGFEATAIFSEEARDPRRTVPRATYIAVGFLAVFYAFILWAVVVAYGPAASVDAATADPANMFFNAARDYVGPWAQITMQVLIITSLFAVLLSFHNAIARYQFSLAREGVLPKVLATTHPKHQSPWVSSLVQSILAAVVVIPFWLANADPFGEFYVPAITPGIYGILGLQALTGIAVIAFFARDRRGLSTFRTIVAPALGVLGLLVVLYFAIANIELITGQQGIINFLLPASAFLVFLIGVILALVFRSRREQVYAEFGTDREALDD